MSGNLSVFDLWGTGKFYIYNQLGTMDATKVSDISLPQILVLPPSDSNKQPYVIGKKDIRLDDILRKISGKYVFDLSNTISMRRLLALLYEQKRPAHCKINLRDWFHAINPLTNDSGIRESSEIVIPVPDRLSVDAQDILLGSSNSGLGQKCTLLWRSVAAFLGNAERLPETLRVGDKIAVVDVEATGTTISYLWLDECDGHHVPAHRLFMDSDTGTRQKTNYPFDDRILPESIQSSIPYAMENGMLVPHSGTNITLINPLDGLMKLNRADCRAIIAIGRFSKAGEDYLRFNFNNTIFDRTGESIAYGAACFANCKQNGITAYYDECEALSLVVAGRDEKYSFKVLIKENQKLRSGLRISGETVDGIFLQPGSKSADFYLRLGRIDRNGKLKSYSQPYEIPDEMKKDLHGKPIELLLQPSLVAGQGRANVEIVPKNRRYVSFIPPVFLDWEEMKDSGITLNLLEETMERSFPPDIPYPRKVSSYYLPYGVLNNIRYFLNDESLLTCDNLNHSQWPNTNRNNVSRFIRLNTFGVPVSDDDGLPRNPEHRALCERFFRELDKRYLKTESSSLITSAAWTYHPEYVPHIMESVREHARHMKSFRNNLGLQPGEASFFANMFTSKSDALLFMHAFFEKLSTGDYYNGVTNANNWYRAAYQVLMSNNSIFSEITKKDMYTAFALMICSYYANKDSTVIHSNIVKVLCFSLKYRQYSSGFCKSDESGELTLDGCFFILLNLLSSDYSIQAVEDYLNRYLQLLSLDNRSPSVQQIIRVYKSIGSKLAERTIIQNIFNEYYTNEEIKRIESKLEISRDDIRKMAKVNSVYFPGTWANILNKYLNGKGNLNIPVSDL